MYGDFDHRQIGITAEAAALNMDMGRVGWLVARFGGDTIVPMGTVTTRTPHGPTSWPWGQTRQNRHRGTILATPFVTAFYVN